LWKRMISHGITPRRGNYKTAILAYSGLGQMEVCERIVSAMEGQGLPLDIAICRAMENGYSVGGNIAKQGLWRDKMESLAPPPIRMPQAFSLDQKP